MFLMAAAVFASVAAAGQPVGTPPGGVLAAETGAECYARLGCSSKHTTRACYLCCSDCTDQVGCQDECDGLYSPDATLDGYRAIPEDGMIDFLSGPTFDDASIGPSELHYLDWLYAQPVDQHILRWAVVLMGYAVGLDTVPAAEADRIYENLRLALDDGRSWRVRVTAIHAVYDAGLLADPGFRWRVVALLLDPVGAVRDAAARALTAPR